MSLLDVQYREKVVRLEVLVARLKRQVKYGRTGLRVTTEERDDLTGMEEGDEVYNLTTHVKNFWNGTEWKAVTTD